MDEKLQQEILHKSLKEKLLQVANSRSIMTPEEIVMALNHYHGKDGVKIPSMHNPDRTDYDQKYFEAIDAQWGAGNNKRLRPIKVQLDQLKTMNQPHNKDRYHLYVRMVRSGDKLPPIVVRKLNNVFFIVDGNHRFEAAKNLGLNELDAYEIVFPKKAI